MPLWLFDFYFVLCTLSHLFVCVSAIVTSVVRFVFLPLVCILCVCVCLCVSFSTQAMSFEAHNLTVPSVMWLGLLPSDLQRFGLNHSTHSLPTTVLPLSPGPPLIGIIYSGTVSTVCLRHFCTPLPRRRGAAVRVHIY